MNSGGEEPLLAYCVFVTAVLGSAVFGAIVAVGSIVTLLEVLLDMWKFCHL